MRGHGKRFSELQGIQKHYPLIASAATSRLRDASVLALCAEPGMGKTRALDEIAHVVIEKGLSHDRLDLRHADPDAALKRVKRFVGGSFKKQDARQSQGYLLVDHIPPMDEAQREAFVRCMDQVGRLGCQVVLALRPEAEALLEDLPSAFTVHAEALLQDESVLCASREDGAWAHELCHGIPVLIDALAASGGARAGRLPGMAYTDGLCSLIESYLRPKLIQEELDLRLALMLLGAGRASEVAEVLGAIDEQIAAGLARDAPFFGVDLLSGTFSCAGLFESDVLSACLRVLQRHVKARRELAGSCLELLVKRGDFKRAALLARLAPEELVVGCAIRHAADFIDAGAAELVKDALEKTRREAAAPVGYYLSALIAYESLYEPRPSLGAALTEDAFAGVAGREERMAWTKARLLACRRLILQGEDVPDELVPDPGDDAMAARLATHVRVLKLLMKGRLTAALQVLLAGESAKTPYSTVSEALLKVDFELLATLLADTPRPSDDGGFERAREFLRSHAREKPAVYADAVPAIAEFAFGSAAAFKGEALLQQASRRGDELARSALGIFSTLADLRGKSYVTGHVRAAQMRRQAEVSKASGVEQSLAIVDCLMRSGVGEDACPGLERIAERADASFSEVAMLLVSALKGRSAQVPAQEPPRDALWLVAALSQGIPDISPLLGASMPASWGESLGAACQGSMDESPERALVLRSSAELQPSSWRRTYPIELRILGSFELRVSGRQIFEQSLQGRRAIDLLAFMASAPNRSARRYEVVDNIWPEYDYASGPNRVSQSLTQLKRCIHKLDPDAEPFKLTRSKLILVDTDQLHSDVDDFEFICAEMARAEGDDGEVARLALQLEGVYRGDLLVIGADGNGEIELRRQRLRTQFVDCMVAGAEAALRQGSARIAARLAEKAALADAIREDAADVLIRSLVASGRPAEAQERYKSFALKLVEATGNPPSRELRRAMGEDRSKRGMMRVEAERMASA